MGYVVLISMKHYMLCSAPSLLLTEYYCQQYLTFYKKQSIANKYNKLGYFNSLK